MKVVFDTVSNKLLFEFDGPDTKSIFTQLAEFQEVLGETICGACGSTNVHYVHRTDKEGNDYYEMKCRKCPARLVFGTEKASKKLFPKRYLSKKVDKDIVRQSLPNNGWCTMQDAQKLKDNGFA